MSGIISDGSGNDSTNEPRIENSVDAPQFYPPFFFFFFFFFASKSNLKIHRTQLPLIKFQIRHVFDGLRFSSIFARVKNGKKKKDKNKIK